MPEKWFVVDAEGLTLGRLAARVATVLRGKNSPHFAPHTHLNTHVVIVNSEKVRLSGKKLEDKKYQWHTIYRTGLKEETAGQLLQRRPTEVIRRAVKGMLPKGALGRTMMRYLRIYVGPEHPHEAQQPQALKIVTRRVREQE